MPSLTLFQLKAESQTVWCGPSWAVSSAISSWESLLSSSLSWRGTTSTAVRPSLFPSGCHPHIYIPTRCSHVFAGEIPSGRNYAKVAKILNIVSLVLGLVVIVIIVVYVTVVVSAVTSAVSSSYSSYCYYYIDSYYSSTYYSIYYYTDYYCWSGSMLRCQPHFRSATLFSVMDPTFLWLNELLFCARINLFSPINSCG